MKALHELIQDIKNPELEKQISEAVDRVKLAVKDKLTKEHDIVKQGYESKLTDLQSQVNSHKVETFNKGLNELISKEGVPEIAINDFIKTLDLKEDATLEEAATAIKEKLKTATYFKAAKVDDDLKHLIPKDPKDPKDPEGPKDPKDPETKIDDQVNEVFG